MSDLITGKVGVFAESLLPSMGLELVDIEYRREGHGWVLRLFIDREGGVSLDDCSMVSREVGAFLDVEDLIEQAYHLEVSSPGLERPLRNLEDFKRFCGKSAKVKLSGPVNGQYVFVGVIRRVQESTVELVLENGESLSFSYDTVKRARLSI